MIARIVCRLVFSAALVLLLGSVSSAQSVPSQVDPNNLTGIMPYNTFGGVRENINLATGNLNLHIPLVSLPGRGGHDFSLGLVYDSKVWNLHYENDSGGSNEWWDDDTQIGWRLDLPTLVSTGISVPINPNQGTVTCTGNFIVTLSDGSKHQFFPATYANWTGARTNCWEQPVKGSPFPYPNILQYSTNDGEYLFIDLTNSSDIVVYEKSGERLHFPSVRSVASKIEDSNGNLITVSGGVITDSVGRSVSASVCSGTCASTIIYKDSNGASQSITLNYTNVSVNPTFVNPPGVGTAIRGIEELTSIILPTNRSYTFQYDNGTGTFGELTKIIYPTGGYTRYDFARYTALHQFPGFFTAADFREVTARHVCRDFGGACTSSTEDTTTYAPTVDGTKTNNQYLDETDSAGNWTHYQFAYGISTDTNRILSPRELSRSIYTGTTPLLRTIQTDYDNLVNGNPVNWSRPIRKTTTLADISPNLVTKTEWDYDTVADNVIAEREYDYGSGSAPTTPLRQTIRTFLHTNPVNSIDYTAVPIYILDRKLSENIQDNTGANFAQTQYEYDNYGTISASGAVQHDSAFATSYRTRGNATKSQVWRNTDGAWLATTKTYDDAGNVLSATDPLNHTTSLSYSDSWSNTTCTPTGGNGAAYVTTVTNALNQLSHYAYYSCSGAMASTTDPNSQTTNFSFDLMNRLVQTNFPDTGQISDCYSDTSGASCYATGQISLTRTDAIATGLNKIRKVFMDGIGNPIQTQLSSDPDGIDYVDTTYDGLERKVATSNPHRSGASSTDGTTQYAYDVLNRVTLVTQPDGSQATTSYSGNQTTVTDEAGKKHKSQTDGIGRLTTVWEDPTGLNYETDYTYDVLGNLLSVNQKGGDPNSANWRTRTFTYDSLSRLRTAANPESGTITYVYDADTNCSTPNSYPTLLVSKTDARGIRTCTQYDAVNRVTRKNYSNSDPTVTFAYDAFVSGANNGIGRRTSMSDASGSSGWTYDTMGRVWTESHTISGILKSISNLYNLDGSLQQITYPSSSVVAYTYNGAGRLTLVKDTAHTITYMQTPAAGTPAYFPPGQLNQATFGNVTETSVFNDRLQPCWFYATTGTALAATTPCTGTATAASVLDLKYAFGLGTNDNGNVQGVTNNKDSNRSIAYTYDALNRIASATTPNTDCSTLSSGITKNWGENFTIDPWSNLTNRTVTKCSAEPLSVIALSSNRLSGFGYDAAGNMTANGGASYTYNAENQLTTAAGVTYTYDGDGNRVKKSNGTLYWGTGPLLESDLSGNLQREFIFANGKRIARRDLPGGGLHYYFTDHLGSADVVTTSTGSIENESDYYPYGGERVYSQAVTNQNYKFTGKERDSESVLDEFGARYYSSGLSRFMIPDWNGKPTDVPYATFGNPQSLNLYSYVQNNPATLDDPDGHGCDTCAEAWDDLEQLVDEGAAEGKDMIGSPGAGGRIVGGAAGFYLSAMLHPKSVGQSDADEMAEKARLQQEKEQTPQNEPELKPDASGAGQGKKGGGRNEQKANQDRVDTSKKDAEKARAEVNRLKSLSVNQRPATYNKDLKAAQGRLNRANDRMRKSETHGRKHKGQKQ